MRMTSEVSSLILECDKDDAKDGKGAGPPPRHTPLLPKPATLGLLGSLDPLSRIGFGNALQAGTEKIGPRLVSQSVVDFGSRSRAPEGTNRNTLCQHHLRPSECIVFETFGLSLSARSRKRVVVTPIDYHGCSPLIGRRTVASFAELLLRSTTVCSNFITVTFSGLGGNQVVSTTVQSNRRECALWCGVVWCA